MPSVLASKCCDFARLVGPASCVFFVISTAAVAQATPTASQELAWWQVVTGILAIPTTIIGLAYSYILIKKTNLDMEKTHAEIEKIALEIREKRETLHLNSGQESATEDSLTALIQPIFQNRMAIVLLLRFAIFSVIVMMWLSLEGLLEFVLVSGILGTGYIFGVNEREFDFEHHPVLTTFALVIKHAPQGLFFLLTVALGLPLFRDINRLLGISTGGVSRFRSNQLRK